MKQRLQLWHKLLPNVGLHYAVKTNPDRGILKIIAQNGDSFDCASASEITRVLKMGVSPDRIIFANSCKTTHDITYAKSRGVNLMTFDSREEALKIHSIFPEAQLIFRIACTNTDAPCPMGMKFGAPEILWDEIIESVKQLGLRLRGVSFHVGSGGCNFTAYQSCLKNAEIVYKMVASKGIPEMNILDIGGGFSMCARKEEYNFDKVAPRVQNYLDNIWPLKSSNIHVIGEPGR